MFRLSDNTTWKFSLFASRLLMITVLNIWVVSTEKDSVREYCEEDFFTAKCGADEVVVIQSARYGRMKTGRCLTSQYGSIGCSLDLLADLDFACSGQPFCSLGVRELIHHNPCPRELRGYLEAQYTCIKVAVPANRTSCRQQTPVSPAAAQQTTSGHLSNYVAEQTGCGGFDAPWQIVAQPGQRINVTLWNFGFSGPSTTELHGDGGKAVCQVLAVITDRAMSETVCAGTERLSAVFLSTTNELQVRLVVKTRKDTTTTKDGRYFLLSYEVIGCPDVVVAAGAWFRRASSSEALFGCNGRSDAWQLVCEKTVWTGYRGNCSNGDSWTSSLSKNGVFHLPFGMNVTITAIVATAIGIFVVIGGLIVVRRKFFTWRQPPKSDFYVDGGEGFSPRHFVPTDSESLPVLPKTALSLPPQVHVRNNVSYGRTWDLQRHSDFRLTPPCPGSPPTVYRMRVVSDNPHRRYADHIYESPNSVRKEMESETRKEKEKKEGGCCEASAQAAQYYEIDPRLTKKPEQTPDLYQLSP